MSPPAVPTRRGLSVLELMLALSITALVAAAISGMMSAVTVGVSTRRDSRSVMVRAYAAQTRLAAYIAPCRSLLARDGPDLVLWLDDSRQSQTVHATEIRWLLFDDEEGAIDVFLVDFPESWSQAARDLEDREYASGTDWSEVLSYYSSNGWIKQVRLVDGLASIAISTDAAAAVDSRQVSYELEFQTTVATVSIRVAATVCAHQPPLS